MATEVGPKGATVKPALFVDGSTDELDISVTEARDQFADLVNEVHYRNVRVFLTRRGERLAALIPAEDLELLEAIEDKEADAQVDAIRKADIRTTG